MRKKGTDHSVHGHPRKSGPNSSGGDRAVCPLFPFPNGPDRILLHEMGGISAAASGPSICRGPRRIFPRTASCIPNRSDETGMPTEDRETPTVYRYAEWLVSGSAFFDQPAESPFDGGKTCIERRAPGVEHDIPLRSEFRAMQAKGRAKTPLDAIANHGSADSARDRKTQSRALDATAPRLPLRPLPAEGGE